MFVSNHAGAMFNLDYVAPILELEGALDVEVRGLLDSPLWMNVDPISTDIISLAVQTQAIYGVINSTRLGSTCTALYPAEADQWQCLFGQVASPFELMAAFFIRLHFCLPALVPHEH